MATQTVTTENNTPERWEHVIRELTGKSHGFETETNQLTEERAALVLDAEMGNTAAQKRLKALDDRIASIRRDSAVTGEAVEKARERLESARAAVRAENERNRQKELRQLAVAALKQAEEFTASVIQAGAAGAALKLTVRNMLTRATPAERANIERLLEYGPYMRAAEAAGLRAHLEFPAYPGPRNHLVSLEQAAILHLGVWLAAGKEQNNA